MGIEQSAKSELLSSRLLAKTGSDKFLHPQATGEKKIHPQKLETIPVSYIGTSSAFSL